MQAIHWAADNCDVDALRRELERGVDPDLIQGTSSFSTPLQFLPFSRGGCGGWANYERRHLDKLTAMLTPKDQTDERRRSRRRLSPLRRLPPEVLRKIVAYAFHAGYY